MKDFSYHAHILPCEWKLFLSFMATYISQKFDNMPVRVEICSSQNGKQMFFRCFCTSLTTILIRKRTGKKKNNLLNYQTLSAFISNKQVSFMTKKAMNVIESQYKMVCY